MKKQVVDDVKISDSYNKLDTQPVQSTSILHRRHVLQGMEITRQLKAAFTLQSHAYESSLQRPKN